MKRLHMLQCVIIKCVSKYLYVHDMIGTVSLRQQLKQRRKLESSARGPAAAGVTWVLLKMLGQTRCLNQPKNVYLTSKDDETCGFYQQLNVYSTSFIATKTCRTSWIQPENMLDSNFTVKMASEPTKRLGLKTKSREFADCFTIRSLFLDVFLMGNMMIHLYIRSVHPIFLTKTFAWNWMMFFFCRVSKISDAHLLDKCKVEAHPHSLTDVDSSFLWQMPT